MNKASLVIADDHPLFIEGVRRIFERENDFTVVAECGDGETALAFLREHRPGLLITDLRMPQVGGLEMLRRMGVEDLRTPTVLLTAEIDDDEMLEAIRLGARGVVLKSMVPDLLVRCARTVLAGESWFERVMTGRALQRLLSHEAARQRIEKLLTPREVELVRRVSEGLRNKEIGARLGINMR